MSDVMSLRGMSRLEQSVLFGWMDADGMWINEWLKSTLETSICTRPKM